MKPPSDHREEVTGRLAGLLIRIKDLAITLLLWLYFTVGFVLFFAPFYLFCFWQAKDRQAAFQKLNQRFTKSFFLLCRILIPRTRWRIDPRVYDIRGAVIVCNHISYLDSILLISLFANHTTIAKNRLFKIPIFGSMIKLSGYLPADVGYGLAHLLVERMETLPAYLAVGGNMIIFPEGTRRRGDKIAPLNSGAFKIARLCRAPITALAVRQTHRLFPPGKFCFDTHRRNIISLTFLDQLAVGDSREAMNQVIERARFLFEQVDVEA